jgi:hypothetical protein
VDGDGDLLMVARDGTVGPVGHVRGLDGTTPPGVEDVDVDEDGNLVVRMSDNRLIARGRVRGRDGKDGAPGLGFDDMWAEFDGERTLTLRWAKDERMMEKAFRIAVPLYRGTWKAENTYERGDLTTYAGGMWFCSNPTAEKPGDGDETKTGWRLATKAPRNGRSAFELARAAGFSGTEKEWLNSLRGAEGKSGPMGPPGRDRS